MHVDLFKSITDGGSKYNLKISWHVSKNIISVLLNESEIPV